MKKSINTYDAGWGFLDDRGEALKTLEKRSALLKIYGRYFSGDSQTLVNTYNSYIRPVIEYRKIHLNTDKTSLKIYALFERKMLRFAIHLPKFTRNRNKIMPEIAVTTRARILSYGNDFIQALSCGGTQTASLQV